MDYETIILTLNGLPKWSIYVIYAVIVIISLIIYFKIYSRLLDEVLKIQSISSGNDRLLMTKIVGFFKAITFLVEFFFFSTCFTLALKKILLLLIGIIGFLYIRSSFKVLDTILTIKFTPHLIKAEDDFAFLFASIDKENNGYYLDAPFLGDKFRIT